MAPTDDGLAFAYVRQHDGREMYLCGHNITVNGRRQYDPRRAPAAGNAGKLRITRAGSEVVFQAAEGSGDVFREVARFNIGPEDLKVVRVAAFPGNFNDPVDVRIIELRVRAQEFGIVLDSKILGQSEPAVSSKAWLPLGVSAAVVVLLALIASIVRTLRRRKNNSETAAPLMD